MQVTMTTMIIQLYAFFLLSGDQITIGKDCHCDPGIRSRPAPYSKDGDRYEVKACEAGQYLIVETVLCAPCPSDTFMTPAMAKGGVQNTTCLPCSQARPNELVVKNCSATQDTEFECHTGYFRSNWSEACPCDWGQCINCHTCGLDFNLFRDHEVLPCTQFHNTKCCEERNSNVDCSPKTTPSLPITTTIRTLLTPTTTRQVHQNQRQKYLEYNSSKCSNKNSYTRLLILSTVFNAYVLNFLF